MKSPLKTFGILFVLTILAVQSFWIVVLKGGLGDEAAPAPSVISSSPPLSSGSRIMPDVFLSEGDGAAISAAITSLPAHGGVVELGPGLFHVSEPIVIERDGVELRGAGEETVLRLTDGANCPVLVIGSTVTPIPHVTRDVIVRFLQIDGNRGTQSFECWGGACDGGDKSFIRNNGITVRGTEDSRIEHVSTHNCRSGGIVLEKGCRRVHISHFEAYNNEFDGLAAYETEDSQFTHMKLHTNRSAGVSVDWRFHHNLVADSEIFNNGSQGIFMRDSSENRFKNLILRNNGLQGIFIAETREIPGSACQRNTFDALSITDNGTEGIRVNDASCVDNEIAHSHISGNGTEDISVAVEGLLFRVETLDP
jgi:parallel beta-helix repeat protein